MIGDASKVVRFALQRMTLRVARSREDEPRKITRADLEWVVRDHVCILQLGYENSLRRKGLARLVDGALS